MGPARRHLHHAVGAALLAAALLAAALLLSAAVPGATAQQDSEDEHGFSYVPGSPNGPDRWGKINTLWAECSNGEMQSPIDLSDDRVTLVRSLGFLNYSYRPAEASIVNRGHDIQVKFSGDAGRLVINGTVYHLRQLHWHTPSEHTVDGRRYDMELHLVHQTTENKTAVIGVLYETGNIPDLFLKTLEPSIRRIGDTRDREEPIGVVDPNGARATGSVYYRYMGSLTTPPCTEGVVWTVFKKVRPVAKYQLEILREAVADGYEDNARPLQEVNNRDISIFRPKPFIWK
ncbi:hypothetical protein SEVIR_6G196000v4 [Setaria viridis]|uniref:Carbonic anhydrase n=2 Tax=Setaria viridis TaxID=4556 RepID=A0A4U6U8H0_SETVI|nr:alpha carbonic anhydrase 7-like [Setaria viridis]TKW10865.1 hypothetical protein SEVIR_6G196000v2 [Setaria viridis]